MIATLLCSLPTWLPLLAPDEFDATWYDGSAELSGYRWSGERYGEARAGEAIAIFVTEPFDDVLRVKLDRPGQRVGDEVTAMKLNLVRDFQTGVYDYNTMTSCFVDVHDFGVLKTTFSSAEWCGHVYEELDFRTDETRLMVRSYFQGESEEQTLDAPTGGVVEEQLFVWLRGLRGAPLKAGASVELPFLASPFERRTRHKPATWGQATLSRSESPSEVTVPAGTFTADLYEIDAPDGRTGTFAIERAAPHRVLSWSWQRGGRTTDAGELTGTRRMRYWRRNREGDEALRRELGL